MTGKADLAHVRAFTDALRRKDLEATLAQMNDAIILKTPLVAEPIKGKSHVRPVVEALFKVVDSFDFHEIMEGPEHLAAFFGLTAGDQKLDGVDLWRLNTDGLIQEMTVFWRPLPDIVAVEAKLSH